MNKINNFISLSENDLCNPNPCENRGTCQVLPLNAYYCTCPMGWTGTNCDQGGYFFTALRT